MNTLNTVSFIIMHPNNAMQVMFTCFLCGKKMDNKCGYREHMKICAFLSDEGTQLFPCFLCREELPNITEYREHLKMCLLNSDCSRKDLCKQTSDTSGGFWTRDATCVHEV